MAEWREKALGDITGYISKGIPPAYTDKNSTTAICVLNQKCNKNFDISYEDSRYHDVALRKVPSEKMLRAEDVLINSTGEGTAGRVAQIFRIPVPTTIDGHMIVMRPTDEVDSVYYGYAIKNCQKKLESIAEGSTGQTEINRRRLQEEVLIKYPVDKDIQKAIGHFLFGIDEKIRNNRKINDNLEQQAQSYFQELFVDNADPEWAIGTISDLGTVVGGSTPSKAKPEYYTESGIAWITPKDLSINKSKFVSHGENDITELGLKNSSAAIMPEGTVLFSSRAPIGYIAIAAGEVTTNQGFKSVVPKPEIGTPFVYFFLKNTLPVIEGMASGSTFKEVSGSTMKNVPAVIPDAETLAKFSDFCAPIFAQQRILEEQNQSLATLRDNLLPKLMSGEIDVSAVQL